METSCFNDDQTFNCDIVVTVKKEPLEDLTPHSNSTGLETHTKIKEETESEVDVVTTAVEADAFRKAPHANDQHKDLEDGFVVDIVKTEDEVENDTVETKIITDRSSAEPSVNVEVPEQRDEMFTRLKSVQTQLEIMNQGEHQIRVTEHISNNYDYIVNNVDHNYAKKSAVDARNETASQDCMDLDITYTDGEIDDNFAVLAEWSIEKKGETSTPSDENIRISGSVSKGSVVKVGACSCCDAQGFTVRSERLINSTDGHRCAVNSGGLVNSTDGQSCTLKPGRRVSATNAQSCTAESGRHRNSSGIITQKSTVKRKIQEASTTVPYKMLIMANHSGERSERQCVFIGSAVLGSAKVQVEPFPGLNTGSFQGKAIGSSPSLDTHAQLDNIAVSSCNVATQNKLISSLSQTPAVESTIPMKYSQEFQPEIASLPVISSENIFKQMPPLTNYAETTQMFRNCSVNISNEEKDKSDSIIEDNIFVDIATVDIHTSFDRDVPLDQSYNVGTEYVSNSETSTYVDNDLAGKLNEEGSRRDQSQIIIEPLTDAALSEPGHIDKQHGLISYSKDVERASNRNSALLPKPETDVYIDTTHACLYCGELFKKKIRHHLVTGHAAELDVRNAMSKDEMEKRAAFEELTRYGNFKHNIGVLKSGQGKLIISRSTTSETGIFWIFLPCIYCLKFFSDQKLGRHCKSCRFQPIHHRCYHRQNGYFIQKAKLLIKYVSDAGYISDYNEDVLDNSVHSSTYIWIKTARERMMSFEDGGKKHPDNALGSSVSAVSKCSNSKSFGASRTAEKGTDTDRDMYSCHDMNVCLYCDSYCGMNIIDHLLEKHRDEPKVIDALAKSDEDRKLILEKLQHRGNYKHNIAVLKSGLRGLPLILATKPKPRDSVNKMDYIPCSYCLAYFSPDSLKSHQKECNSLPPFRPGSRFVKQQAKIKLLEDNFRFAQTVGGTKYLSPLVLERISVPYKTGLQTERTSLYTSQTDREERNGLAADGVPSTSTIAQTAYEPAADEIQIDSISVAVTADDCQTVDKNLFDDIDDDIPETPADNNIHDGTVIGSRSGRKSKPPERYGRFLLGQAAESKMTEEIDADMDIDYDDDLVDQSYTPKESDSENDEVAGQSDNSDEDSENDLKIPKEGTEESAKSSNNGKRVPKHTTCCFCDKLIKGRVMRHILMVHKMHERVKLVLKLSKGSPERKKLLGFLLTEVYFKHNKKVLETGTGELVVHKKQAHLPASSFRPCKRCKQLIQTKKWKGHETVCMSYDSEFGEFMQCLGDGVVDESESDSEDDEYMTVEDSDYDAGKLQIVEESGSDGGKSETSPPGGTTDASGPSNAKKRVRKSKSCCFCDKLIKAKLISHIIRKHRMHKQVKPIHKLPKGSPEQKKLMEFLLKEAYFKHNKKVLETGVGELTVYGRLGPRPLSDFLPCEHCKMLILRNNLDTHKEECVSHDDELSKFMQSLGDIVTDIADSDSDSSGELIEEEDPVTEEDIDYVAKMLENAPPGVTIPALEKKQIYSNHYQERKTKALYCTFCGKDRYHMSSHLFKAHKKCKRVTELLKLSKESRERFVKLQILVNEGNFKHNLKVLKDGVGYLVVRKRDRKFDMKPSDVYPCKFCKSLVRKKYSTRDHEQRCVMKLYLNGVSSGQKKTGKGKKTEDENVKDCFVTRNEVVEMTALIKKYTEAASEGPVNVTITDRKKGHYCLFCGKIKKSKISRHIERKHLTNDRVAEIALLPKFSQERASKLATLIREGDFKYNMKVLKAGKGEIIVSRSSACLSSQSPADYYCCLYCKKFLLRRSVWTHRLSCKPRKTVNSRQLTNAGDNDGDVDISVAEAAVGIFRRRKNGEKRLAAVKAVSVKVKDKTHCRQFCPLCDSYLENQILRHLEQAHKDNKHIQLILSLPKQSVERQLRLTLLLNEGDYKHNTAVLRHGQGEILVSGERSDQLGDRLKASDFAPCQYCKKFLLKQMLQNHSETCKIRNFFQLELPEVEGYDDTDHLHYVQTETIATAETVAAWKSISSETVRIDGSSFTTSADASFVAMPSEASSVISIDSSCETTVADVCPVTMSADAIHVTSSTDESSVPVSTNTSSVTISADVASITLTTNASSLAMKTGAATSADASSVAMSTDAYTAALSTDASTVTVSTDAYTTAKSADASTVTMSADAYTAATSDDASTVTMFTNVFMAATSADASTVIMPTDVYTTAYTAATLTDASTVTMTTDAYTAATSADASTVTMSTDINSAANSADASTVTMSTDIYSAANSADALPVTTLADVSTKTMSADTSCKMSTDISTVTKSADASSVGMSTYVSSETVTTDASSVGMSTYVSSETVTTDASSISMVANASSVTKSVNESTVTMSTNALPVFMSVDAPCVARPADAASVITGSSNTSSAAMSADGFTGTMSAVVSSVTMTTDESSVLLATESSSESMFSGAEKVLHSCIFCGKLSKRTNILHLKGFHKDKKCVRSILPFKRRSMERMLKFTLLQNLGDYHYNMEALKTDPGNLTVKLDSSTTVKQNLTPADFSPCEYCKRFIWKKWTLCHSRQCKIKRFYNQFGLGNFIDRVEAERMLDTDTSEELLTGDEELLNSRKPYKTVQQPHLCALCGKTFGKWFAIHLQCHHKNVECARSVLQLPKGSDERLVKLMLFWSLGDYRHNMDVLRAGQGTLHTSVSNQKGLSSQNRLCIPADFVVCKFCKKFIRKSGFERHNLECKAKKFYVRFELEKFSEEVIAEAEKISEGTAELEAQRTELETQSIVTVKVIKKKGPRFQYCTFCGENLFHRQTNHMITAHKDDERVSQIIKLPRDSEERKVRLSMLLYEGNYKHNLNVMKKGRGEFIIPNSLMGNLRPESCTLEDFVLCEQCKRFMSKKSLHHHQYSCRVKRFFQPQQTKVLVKTFGNEQQTVIKVMEKHGENGPIFHYCTFCEEKKFGSITNHFVTDHKGEERVSQITELPQDSEERKIRLSVLLHYGDYKHNLNVLKNGCGEFIILKSLMGDLKLEDCTLEDFIACDHCKRFMSTKLLQHHKYTCRVKKFFQPRQTEVRASEGEQQNQSMAMSPVKNQLLHRLTLGKVKRGKAEVQILPVERRVLPGKVKRGETEVQELPVERRVLPVRAARKKPTPTKVHVDDDDDGSKASDGDENVDDNSEEVGIDDSDADSDYDFKRDIISDPDYKQDLNLGKVEKTVRFAKHRWTEEENTHFCRIFAGNIKERTMPTRSLLDEAVRLIKNRTILQIRTRVHNIIKDKQKKY